MVRKKLDNRLRILIENGVKTGHRSMFVIVGDKAKDQVVILHHMLSKSVIKARPSVLWCYKKDLGFSSHRKKRMKQLQKKIRSGKLDVKEDDPFELFVAATNIRYCYYSETHKVLGNTYGVCVLQDFEAISPNLMARTLETVEGGGIIVFLMKSVKSLKQLYSITMDVHSRFRTESHQDVIGRFNERFILSLGSCKNCIVVDDDLNILPISAHALEIEAAAPQPITENEELKELKASMSDTPHVSAIVNCCKTLDQAKAVLKFIDAICEKTLKNTVTMTAARGRGKSAALGLSLATAVAYGYSNIFVTAPSPENLKTLFQFILKGFDALKYEEHTDYELIESTNPDLNKAIVRINITKEHRQTIQYIHPTDAHKLSQAELVAIDEAAAIPLPLVKDMLGPYLVLMSSTINGYEGTGRSLSLKLINQLRTGNTKEIGSRKLTEIELNESIRYANGDHIERWLNDLLCLDASSVTPILSGCPLPESCNLYYVNRDTLFSYHKASEAFLHRLMALYVSSHYKNSPNDLQLLSDAPAHHIFVLLPPTKNKGVIPEVLCVLQVCLEGDISKKVALNTLKRGDRPSGDLIPWTVSHQFTDENFPLLSGARVVRIATHPNYQSMGYGSRALELLELYYKGSFTSLDEMNNKNEEDMEESSDDEEANEKTVLQEETLAPRKKLKPLLEELSERKAENLDYLGVSFGLTSELYRFWKKSGFAPVYLRQTSVSI